MRGVALVALLLLPGAAPAAIYHLEADGSGDFPTIAAALAVATAGDVVELGCGTYYEHDLVIPTGVTLRSEGGVASCATIDAQQQGRVLQGRPAELSGLTIRNGCLGTMNGAFGAGAYLGAAVSILNCSFLDNLIDPSPNGKGGGLYQYSGHAHLVACQFKGNTANHHGSGAHFDRSAELSFCHFEGDDLKIGGSHPAPGSRLDGCVLLDCNVSLSVPSPQIRNCVLARGRLWLWWDPWPEVELLGTTLVEEEVLWWGGNLVLSMHGCLLSASSIQMVLFPVEVENATCNDFHDTQITGGIADWLGHFGNISADPLFCDAPGGDYRLHANSPCAPAGNACGALIGALPVGCDATGIETKSWSSIKALY